MTAAALPEIEVVAAVLRDRDGRVLIAERPAGKPLAGFWEFPGGKLEPGEPAASALKRELKEELGIHVERAHRLLRLSHTYPERRVHLDVWRVVRYSGAPASHEGQRLAWVPPAELRSWRLLPADEPIVTALKFPPLMLVTPAPDDTADFLTRLEGSLEAGVDFVQFRAPGLSPEAYGSLAQGVIAACRRHGARVHLNAAPGLALELGADGVHLSQATLAQLSPRDLDRRLAVGASCHSAEEVSRALTYAPDYLSLGTVQASASHPGASPLGWDAFQALARMSPVPVYAIGGLGYGELSEAQRRGAHGIAAIRHLWGGFQSPTLS
ncbi:MAG TPA: Nudix family hydrolase [Gammaproteobacteria bacterium]|nr:Nudix family hydrolase [Gammaproteobacteria bacterium]